MTAGTDAGLPLDGTIVVFDLEWTAWEGSKARGWDGPGEEMEIVQIGVRRRRKARQQVERVYRCPPSLAFYGEREHGGYNSAASRRQ